MDLYLKLFEVLFPVFFVVGIGYYLGKKNPKIDTTFITNFAANIGTPAMIIYALTATGTSFEIFKDYFWYSLIAIVAFTFIGLVFLFFLITKILFVNYHLLLCQILVIWVYQYVCLLMDLKV